MATHGLGYWYIEIEKQAFWRGVPHTWVNRYVMSGADPTAADAASTIGELKAIEDVIHWGNSPGDGVGFVEGRAYSKDGGPPIASVDYNISKASGTATGFTGGTYASYTTQPSNSLEVCLATRTLLTGLSSTGKPIYLKKYIRGTVIGTSDEGAVPGVIPSGVITAMNAVIAPWKTGLATNSYVVIGTSGKQASTAPTFENYFSNHQVPRGRKKKS